MSIINRLRDLQQLCTESANENFADVFGAAADEIVRLSEVNKMNWISTQDRLPKYGVPVILCINGVVQHVTYALDGADDYPDWFEPYFFDSEPNLSVWWHRVSHWMYLPEPPK